MHFCPESLITFTSERVITIAGMRIYPADAIAPEPLPLLHRT